MRDLAGSLPEIEQLAKTGGFGAKPVDVLAEMAATPLEVGEWPPLKNKKNFDLTGHTDIPPLDPKKLSLLKTMPDIRRIPEHIRGKLFPDYKDVATGSVDPSGSTYPPQLPIKKGDLSR